jgi:ribulose bisphosphate carboxylase small subunit
MVMSMKYIILYGIDPLGKKKTFRILVNQIESVCTLGNETIVMCKSGRKIEVTATDEEVRDAFYFACPLGH